MAADTNDNKINAGADGSKVELHAENQRADKIINAGVVQGDINNNTTNNYYVDPKKDTKPANKFLCRKLIEAIRDYSEDAVYFLENDVEYSDKKDKWETDDDTLGAAKSIIISSYASVLGGFLSKLIASGNTKDYFDMGLTTTKRTLQLLCFAFISSLWDHSKEKQFQFSADQQNQLKKFFKSPKEPNISGYAELFKTLITIFQEQQLEYPIPEIKNMEADFKGENIFFNTCKTLDDFRSQFGEDQAIPAVDEIEKALTSFLVSLNFLASYKMVSVKDIEYESVRNNNAQFVHAYTILGANNGNSTNGEKYKFYDKPFNINTEAVILFKENYLEGLNLFPFIIDKNALKNKNDDLPQIFFYAGIKEKEKRLIYVGTYKTSPASDETDVQIIDFTTDSEDMGNKLKAINKSNDKDITEFKTNKEKYEKLRKYEWYITFQQARQTFCGDDVF